MLFGAVRNEAVLIYPTNIAGLKPPFWSASAVQFLWAIPVAGTGAAFIWAPRACSGDTAAPNHQRLRWSRRRAAAPCSRGRARAIIAVVLRAHGIAFREAVADARPALEARLELTNLHGALAPPRPQWIGGWRCRTGQSSHWSISQVMVGTPVKAVTCSRSIRDSASSAFHLYMSTSLRPGRKAVRKMALLPVT